MADDLIYGMFQALSAILWIGNLTFQDTDSEACQLTKGDEEVVRKISTLLGISEAQVRKVCTIRQISVKGTTTDIALKLSEASSLIFDQMLQKCYFTTVVACVQILLLLCFCCCCLG